MSTFPMPAFWTIADWRTAYLGGRNPDGVLSGLLASMPDHDVAWITRVSLADLQQRLSRLAAQLQAAGGDIGKLPLYGVPFAVKDNIDVAGLPTTCACPEFAYIPERSATVVEHLEAAGAVVIGKTNLDQFATGLVGTRSPYGPVPNTFKPEYISGGSSSGSASVVARGLVPFALGTDTAGSGRVPAGHNNLVGLKPTRGRVSTTGLVPACRTLDCITVFALSVEDAEATLRVMGGFDESDPYSRHAPARPAAWPEKPRLGIPARMDWFGDAAAEGAHDEALCRLDAMGVELMPVDFTLLFETAALLYEGPWVGERYAALEPLMKERPEVVHPVVRGIVSKAVNFSAVDTYKAEYRRMELARKAEALIRGLDGLLVPTSPSIYTIEAVLADPVTLNSRMGVYTNFVNLLDWSAIALPAGMRGDGLPAGITLIAPGWHEARLIEFGRQWQQAAPWRRGASDQALPPPAPVAPTMDGQVVVAVVGAHLSGMPLNWQLTERGAVLLETTQTSAAYRFYALPGTVPPKPGLVRTGDGAPITVELWAMPAERFGSFVALIPSPLGIGSLELIDGRRVQGFVCENWATEGAEDITALGGWRAYMTPR
ncbi:allophanate hydrolase [Pseudothauera nasutitermitis]|uniref:Allophanate hydrolase n=1 Tax=Pseudothauera nasutitermitis TaxID=2565930 RepID=A0A4S4AZP9_9RHOO|nr:allophanate hydrolase [Pseudothauera nasutitermitis]THF65641.1 allophanate hydrolase [Pseudothauera nasutitermitis]